MRNILFSAVALAAFASPGHCRDANFSGPWVGVTGGYERLTADDDGNKTAKGGVVYGAALGYDFDLGGVIAGPEVEIGDASTKITLSNVLVTGDKFAMSAGRDIYAGIRIGAPVTENLMIYAKGGYTNLRTTSTYTRGTTVENDAAKDGGYRVGAGAELNLGGPFVRAEYRYSNYGDFNDSDVRARKHQAVVTAGFRF